MKLEERIAEYMKKEHMTSPGDHILVGVSGGADSVCLLLVLHALEKELGIRLSVLHVNHGIRQEAGEDADYVKELCARLQIPFYLEEADIPALARTASQTEEEAGRNARYMAFGRKSREIGASKIAVAHNLNDQAETMLLNLARGSGLNGLSGIPPVRGSIIRPLLAVSRHEIEAFLSEKNVSFQTDRTNLEDNHTRNRIRHHVLPYLESEVNSGTLRHMGSAAEEALEARTYIEEEARRALAGLSPVYREGSVKVSLTAFSAKPVIIRKYTLMELLSHVTAHRKDIAGTHIESLLALCEDADGSASLDLPYGLKAVRAYDELTLFLPDAGPRGQRFSDWTFDMQRLEVPEGKSADFLSRLPRGKYTKWMDYDKIHSLSQFEFRTRRAGDTIVIDRMGHSKSLKKFMIDEKIPENFRDDIPLLADGSSIVWVVGSRMSCAYEIGPQTRHILEVSANPKNTSESR